MKENIPLELRALPQWVCAGPNKVPLSPRTGQVASVTDPRTWGTFDEAVRTGMPYVGFVLTDWDPYTIIDLDNKPEKPCTPEQWALHQRILERFESYTERSASGTGYHIIVRGRVPTGFRRDNVEVYSTARYMICTGDVVRNAPIVDCQHLLDELYLEMHGPVKKAELEDTESVLSDEEIVEMASRAANADKYLALCQGKWKELGYPSQSEADFALLSIYAFYTPDNEQVRRLFRMSALGKRDKALRNDRYLNHSLAKIRAQQSPPVDLSKLSVPMTSVSTPEPPPPPSPPPSSSLELPPGLVGEIAQYIYQSSIRPVPEISLAAAIALVAGIIGRSYNISGTGLNQYIILLAKTGAGKEGAATGIENLVSAVRPIVPMVDRFIGPSAFASGQALIKVLDEQPCFVSILGEFGLTLQQLCDPRANSAQVMLRKVLLDLYNKSGWNKVLRSSVYSDTSKNTKLIRSPNVTILGESTPETFFEGLDATHISEGLIPRFSVIEYTGPRPSRNRNADQPPSPELVRKVAELVTIGLTTMNNGTCANVQIDPAALVLLDQFDLKADQMINSANSDVDMQLWNRAHLKALKLAGVIAVGVNPHAPVVTEDIARWCIAFVERDVTSMTTRFQRGEVGVGDHRHEADIRKAIEAYLNMTPKQREQYRTPKSIIDKPIIPYHYLRRRLRLRAAFKNDRRGVTRALQESLRDLVEAEILKQIPPQQALNEFGISSPLYVLGPTW